MSCREGPGWGNYTTQRQNYARQQGAPQNWTPQYQQQSYRDDPYDQRRADSHQSAPYNARRDQYGPDGGYGQGQRAGYSSYDDPNRYSNPYPTMSTEYSPYRAQMGGENSPRGMGQRDFGESWYGQPPYGQSNASQAGYRQPNYGQTGFYGGGASHSGKAPKGYKRSDDRIKEEVCDTLMHAGHLDPSDIEVTVSDGEVTLKGEVCCRNDKRQVEDLAERVLGVKDVHTNLRIKKQEHGSQQSRTGSSSQESDANGNARTSGGLSSSTKESKFAGSGSNR